MSAVAAHRWRVSHQDVPQWVLAEFETFWSIAVSTITDFITDEQKARDVLTAKSVADAATITDLTAKLAVAQAKTLSDDDMAAIKSEELTLAGILNPTPSTPTPTPADPASTPVVTDPAPTPAV